jgi:plasmid stabilization system protein ParE
MTLPLLFLPEARAEFDEAANWYQEHTGRGAAFTASVQETLDRIAALPRLYAVIEQDVRRAVVLRFPYAVLYRIESDCILVVAVFHAKRDSAVWQARLS